jgi:hypothetical protein
MRQKVSDTFMIMDWRKGEEEVGNGGIKHENVSSDCKTKDGNCEGTADNRMMNRVRLVKLNED